MGNYDDFYEKVFGPINIGDDIKIYKDGETFEGKLVFKNKYYITVQLPFYREGFSMPDFFIGHSKLAGVDGIDFPVETSDDDGYEEDKEDFDIVEEETEAEFSEPDTEE